MPQIHPSATVSPQSQLADDVIIGPRCTIEGEVTLGPGTRLMADVHLQGPLTVGARNTFYPSACIGFAPQHRGFDPAVPGAGCRIGDDNVFRESVTVHRAMTGRPTTIGDRSYFMVNSHIGHDCAVGNDCTLTNGAALAGHVDLGDGVTIGGNSGVHQFCRVGRLAMVGAVAPIMQDLPPFCVAYEMRSVGSLNIVALRRAGYREHIAALKRAFDILYHGEHTNAHAADRIEKACGDNPLCREFAAFIRETKRGITPYGGRRRAMEEDR